VLWPLFPDYYFFHSDFLPLEQGCQKVCFQTKNTNLGKSWRILLWEILVYFMTIWSILRPLEIFYGHSVYCVVIWCIFPRFGTLDQAKSGNPALELARAAKRISAEKNASFLSL
jgi:hypothetical protein